MTENLDQVRQIRRSSPHWLDAYRVAPGVPVFAGSIGLVTLVALLTTSYQAIRAATSNPVAALRYE